MIQITPRDCSIITSIRLKSDPDVYDKAIQAFTDILEDRVPTKENYLATMRLNLGKDEVLRDIRKVLGIVGNLKSSKSGLYGEPKTPKYQIIPIDYQSEAYSNKLLELATKQDYTDAEMQILANEFMDGCDDPYIQQFVKGYVTPDLIKYRAYGHKLGVYTD